MEKGRRQDRLEFGDACLDGVADQVGLPVDVQLGHHAAAVGVDRVDGQGQLGGDLLVAMAFVSCRLSMLTFAAGNRLSSSRAVSMPFMLGVVISSMNTSAQLALAISRASNPSDASPTIVISRHALSIVKRSPSRTTG